MAQSFHTLASPGNPGRVTLNALRMADGKKVFGRIDAAGTLTITDEQLDVEAVVLERIN